MENKIFSLWIDNVCMAKEMSSETAAILMTALFNEYYNEPDLKITIQREKYEPVMDGSELEDSEDFIK